MSVLDPIAQCRGCGAELPPFSGDCPHCGASWRNTLTDSEKRQERRIGTLAALIWLPASLLILCLATLLPSKMALVVALGVLGGYPGLFVILTLFGKSRNKGNAAVDGCSMFFFYILVLLFIVYMIACIDSSTGNI